MEEEEEGLQQLELVMVVAERGREREDGLMTADGKTKASPLVYVGLPVLPT